MNVKILHYLLLGAISIPTVAFAEKVELYGKIDLGITRLQGNIPDTKKITEMQQNHGSRFGFRGSETISNETSVIFQVESRFYPDTGKQNSQALFYGPVFVGVTNKQYGEIRLGRNWSTVDSASTSSIDPFSGDGVAGFNEFTRARINNTVTYYSPEINNIKIQGQYIFSEKTSSEVNFDNNNGYAFAISYNKNGLMLQAGYGLEENSNKQSIATITGSYQFTEKLNISIGYDEKDTKIANTKNIQNYVLGLTWKTESGLIKTGLNRTKNGFDNFSISSFYTQNFDTIDKFGLGYQHDLSKRSSIYADFGFTRFKSPKETYNQQGFGVGITHNF